MVDWEELATTAGVALCTGTSPCSGAHQRPPTVAVVLHDDPMWRTLERWVLVLCSWGQFQ